MDEITKYLQSLGFTKYEIRVLICLYENGPLQADQVAKYTKVPLARVYDALDNLKRKKFLTVSNGRPKIFTAENPQIATTNFIETERRNYRKHVEELTKISLNFLELAQDIYFKNNTVIMPDDLLTQFHSLKDAEKQTKLLIQQAEVTIDIFTHTFNWFENVKQDLIGALERGCKIRVVLNKHRDLSDLMKLGIDVKINKSEKTRARGTLVDNKHVLFIIWARDHDKMKQIFRPQYSSNLGLIQVFTHFYENLWSS